MKIKLDPGAFAPTRAHDTDAGLDLYAMEGAVIPPKNYCTFETGVHVQLPDGCAGLLVSKSGLNVNSHITSTGLIDQGFSGAIRVKLYNHGWEPYEVHAGDKISQLVVIPVRYEPVEIVDEIDGGPRGDAGFGSTG